MERKQPEWHVPSAPERPTLKVRNSLASGQLVEFIPQKGNIVTWYTCGPTVYDSAHMGHARNYVMVDVLRRILEQYFGYEVQLTMNITDVDDKIIKRSRELGEDFGTFAKRWELEFMNDMKSLNVQPPEVITRVSEYIPEVVECVQRIIEHGFGYESNGSVYFDTAKFKADPKHFYGRLEPWSVMDVAKIEDGEGALSITGEKRSPTDFALWKKSKEGEPSWQSPWGLGRPGWHIECTAMAAATLPERLDIHSGGIDLRFPHHENELAQAEAYYDCPGWVNYFLHAGHLEIQGLKMSKSLKNFITIKDALQEYGAREIRMLFVMHNWDAPMCYGPSSMTESYAKVRQFSEFFQNVKVVLRNAKFEEQQAWTARDKNLMQVLNEIKQQVHAAFCDNFNTPSVLEALSALVSETNKYLNDPSERPRWPLVRSVGLFIHRIMHIFGLVEDSDIGFNVSDGNAESTIAPLMELFAQFREDIRTAGLESSKMAQPLGNAELSANLSRLLRACDRLRDEQLPQLGIRLEDRTGPHQPVVWKYIDKEDWAREKAKKAEEAEAKAAQKAALAAANKQKEEQKKAQARISPSEFMRAQTDKYSAWDEEGKPTHDVKGEPLSKSASKAALKAFETQKKLHEDFLAKGEQ